MKNLITAAIFTMALATHAQTKFEPKTGDIEADRVLQTMNTSAQKDKESFSKDVSAEFGIEKTKVDQMLQSIPPADVYMIAQTANITKKPVEDVSTLYQANKEKGWGVIAKEAGIKPGSAEFHTLKGKIKEHNRPAKGNTRDKSKDKGKKGKSQKGGKTNQGKGSSEKDTESNETSPAGNTEGTGSGRG